MKTEYLIRENGKFEEITPETALGLVFYSEREVFKKETLGFEERFFVGLKGKDYFGNNELHWKELLKP